MIRRGTATRLGIRRPVTPVVECWHRGACFCGMGLGYTEVRNMVPKDPITLVTAEQLGQMVDMFKDDPSAFKIGWDSLAREPRGFA